MPKINDFTQAPTLTGTELVFVSVNGSASYKTNTQAIADLGGGSGSVNTTTANATINTSYVQVVTTSTTSCTALTVTLPTNTYTTIEAVADCVQSGTSVGRTKSVFRIMVNKAGTVTPEDQVTMAGAYDVVASGSAMSNAAVYVNVSGTNALVNVVAHNSTETRWLLEARVKQITANVSQGLSYDPSVLSLTGWWQAGNYNATTGTWTGSASAGGSGARNLTEATNKPATGTALNGYDTVDFVRANSDKLTGAAWTDLFAVSAYSGWALIYADSWASDNANPNLSDGILSETSGTWGISGRSTGPAVTIQHDDGTQQRVASNMSTGTWHLIQFRHSTAVGFMEMRIDSGAWSTIAAGNLGAGTGNFQVGCEYVGSLFTDGRIADIGTTNSRLDDTTFDNIVTYVNEYYGLSL